jgi:hypothetical protein
MITFITGLVIGACIGVVVMAAVSMNKEDDFYDLVGDVSENSSKRDTTE